MTVGSVSLSRFSSIRSTRFIASLVSGQLASSDDAPMPMLRPYAAPLPMSDGCSDNEVEGGRCVLQRLLKDSDEALEPLGGCRRRTICL